VALVRAALKFSHRGPRWRAGGSSWSPLAAPCTARLAIAPNLGLQLWRNGDRSKAVHRGTPWGGRPFQTITGQRRPRANHISTVPGWRCLRRLHTLRPDWTAQCNARSWPSFPKEADQTHQLPFEESRRRVMLPNLPGSRSCGSRLVPQILAFVFR
jgi:hypothetical protein